MARFQFRIQYVKLRQLVQYTLIEINLKVTQGQSEGHRYNICDVYVVIYNHNITTRPHNDILLNTVMKLPAMHHLHWATSAGLYGQGPV